MGDMLRYAWAGLLLRCPNCSKGRMFRNLFTINEACPHCGVVFEREEGDFLGAMVVAYSILAVIVAAGIYITEMVTHLDAMVHVVLWGIFTLVFMLLFYRNMKGIWVGMLHAMVGLKPRQKG